MYELHVIEFLHLVRVFHGMSCCSELLANLFLAVFNNGIEIYRVFVLKNSQLSVKSEQI